MAGQLPAPRALHVVLPHVVPPARRADDVDGPRAASRTATVDRVARPDRLVEKLIIAGGRLAIRSEVAVRPLGSSLTTRRLVHPGRPDCVTLT